jgi:hypothetical protein
MEPEVSLMHSQVPGTCSYPGPAQSSPYPHIPLPEDPSQYYPPIYVWNSQVVSSPQVTLPKSCMRLSSSHTRYMLSPSHSSRFYHLNNVW